MKKKSSLCNIREVVYKALKKDLEDYLEHSVSKKYYEACMKAYRKGHAGPAALGGYAVLGLYTPFEEVLGHEFYKTHSCWPCGETIGLGRFFRSAVKRQLEAEQPSDK